MAHKTLIGGTAYAVKGGKTLVDGTAYAVKGGKTLLDGTAYDVGFLVNIDVTGSGGLYLNGSIYKNYAYVEIDGESYGGNSMAPSMVKTYSLSAGTVITCTVGARGNGNISTITINGQVIKQVTATSTAVYEVSHDYIVTKNATITLSYQNLGTLSLIGTIVIEEH